VKGINKLLSEKNIIEVITVKKNRFTEFFKGKGYYVLLFVGVIAIAAVAIIGSQLSSNNKDEGQNQVDLNDTDNNIAAGEDNDQQAQNNPVSEGIVNNGDNSSGETASNDNNGQEVASNNGQAELEGYGEDAQDNAGQTQSGNQTETADAQTSEDAAVETAGSSVQNDISKAVEALSFSSDDGLLWPVNGNVIMNYSMDHTIYHATLMKYACNPAIIIDAEVGTEVKSAAKGVISSIDFNEETGNTVTMDIGDGYKLVYGQLKEDSIKLDVGDEVDAGDVIGSIDEPTKYYTVEGSNLYFQVLENDQTVNPMLYLK
jgi:murein DD-endopeptidase MepM/ murein hydrolase activator NlpD